MRHERRSPDKRRFPDPFNGLRFGPFEQEWIGSRPARLVDGFAPACQRRYSVTRRPAIDRDQPFVEVGQVDHSGDVVSSLEQSNQHRPGRQTANQGSGSVDRVDAPLHRGVGPRHSKFLAADAMIGEPKLDRSAHCQFSCTIGLGDRIELSVILALRGEASGQGIANCPPRQVGKCKEKFVIHPTSQQERSAIAIMQRRGSRQLTF